MFFVAVILGTYNGESYLKEQIDSILNQEDVSVQVFARDDGSKDNTVKILRSYAGEYPNFHLLDNGNTQNKGVRNGFMEALKWAKSYSSEYDFFAFSDQDDVWLPQKLKCAIEKIQCSVNKNGAIYYSNKTIVDENLTEKYQEDFTEFNDFSNYLFVSHAYGCTMVINRTLADISCQFVSHYAHFHDDWIHRLAICIGADIVFDNNSYILYRQHGNNNCGTFATEDKSLSHLIKRAFLFSAQASDGQNRSQLSADILKNFSDIICEDYKHKLLLIADYKIKIRNRFLLIKTFNLKDRRLRDVIIWRIKVLLGYF